MNRHETGFRWMSEKSAQTLLAEGFWGAAVYRGIIKFAIPGIFLLTMVGLLWSGVQTFDMDWWRRGSIGLLGGGFIGGAILWLIASAPQRVRQILNWCLAIALFGGGAIYLFAKLDWVSALVILVAMAIYVVVLLVRENRGNA